MSHSSHHGSHSALFAENYIIEKSLGEGMFGKVKLATHVKSQKQVALKIVEKSLLTKAADIMSIKREARILKFLSHPHIVKLRSVMETNKDIIFEMEYVAGGELYDFISANKRLEEKVARKIFRQIVSAISYCHQSCVIHRDLKPENVLLDMNQDVKLTDFGFVNFYNPEARLKSWCGTPHYASPEIVDGKEYVGPEVDVWSMGVILYAMLTGTLPFRHDNMKELYRKIRHSDYVLPSHVSPAAQDLISRMLCASPRDRITMADISQHPFVTHSQQLGPPPTYIPPRSIPLPEIDVDEMVLKKMRHYHFDTFADKALLCGDKMGTLQAVAIYHLVKEHVQRHTPNAPSRCMDSAESSRSSISQSSSAISSGLNSSSPSIYSVRSSIPGDIGKSDADLNAQMDYIRRRRSTISSKEPLKTAADTLNMYQKNHTNLRQVRRRAASDGYQYAATKLDKDLVSTVHRVDEATSKMELESTSVLKLDPELGSIVSAAARTKVNTPMKDNEQADRESSLEDKKAARASFSSFTLPHKLTDTFKSALKLQSNVQEYLEKPVEFDEPRVLSLDQIETGDRLTHRDTAEIKQELMRILDRHSVTKRTWSTSYKLSCHKSAVEFDIEIILIKGTARKIIRLTKRKGLGWLYQTVTHKIVQDLIAYTQ